MNDWYKKGDLPPVGTECMVFNHDLGKNAEWEKCTILFVGEFKCVYTSESCKERVGDVDIIGKLEFKPICQEREAFVQEFITPLVYSDDSPLNRDSTWEEIAEVLFDAGYRKVKPLSFVAFNQMYRQCDRSENLYHMIKSHIVSEG